MTSVLIVGALENVPEALESCYGRALSFLGHEVIRWDPAVSLIRIARFGRAGALFSRFVTVEPWYRKANEEFLALVNARRPDIIIIIGTGYIRAGTLAQIRVQNPRTKILCIYPDSPHMLDTVRISALSMFDRVFTSSPSWVESFQRLGAKHVECLFFAADTLVYQPALGAWDKEPEIQVGFVGTWRKAREELLENLSDTSLAIWGSSYWATRTLPKSSLRNSWKGRALTAHDLSDVCANTAIMLNIIDGHTWPGPNMRCFELPACGAFALVTRTPAVLEVFTEGDTVECFETIEEAQTKIVFYLKDKTSRQRIAKRSYEFVRDEKHTYIDRANYLLESCR